MLKLILTDLERGSKRPKPTAFLFAKALFSLLLFFFYHVFSMSFFENYNAKAASLVGLQGPMLLLLKAFN